MKIMLNDEVKTFPEQWTVQQLLNEIIPEKQSGIAVAVNSQVIPKNKWEHHPLYQNDDVLIIKPAQGG